MLNQLDNEKQRKLQNPQNSFAGPLRQLKKEIHGLRECYRAGCRCEKCRAANAERHKKWADANREHIKIYKKNRRDRGLARNTV